MDARRTPSFLFTVTVLGGLATMGAVALVACDDPKTHVSGPLGDRHTAVELNPQCGSPGDEVTLRIPSDQCDEKAPYVYFYPHTPASVLRYATDPNIPSVCVVTVRVPDGARSGKIITSGGYFAPDPEEGDYTSVDRFAIPCPSPDAGEDAGPEADAAPPVIIDASSDAPAIDGGGDAAVSSSPWTAYSGSLDYDTGCATSAGVLVISDVTDTTLVVTGLPGNGPITFTIDGSKATATNVTMFGIGGHDVELEIGGASTVTIRATNSGGGSCTGTLTKS